MPAGPLPLGLAYFGAVKLAGYTAAGYRLRRTCPGSKVHPITFGAARTVLGLIAGVGVAALASRFDFRDSDVAFYFALAPVRMAEWLFILWLFYARAG